MRGSSHLSPGATVRQAKKERKLLHNNSLLSCYVTKTNTLQYGHMLPVLVAFKLSDSLINHLHNIGFNYLQDLSLAETKNQLVMTRTDTVDNLSCEFPIYFVIVY